MVEVIATYLNVANFEVLKVKHGQNNYNYQYNLGEHIFLRLDGPMNAEYQRTCHLELKGMGCRDFENRNITKTWVDLIMFFINLNGSFKRIDIAIDDFDGSNIDLEWLTHKTDNKYYTSVFKLPVNPIGTVQNGLTLQFGTNTSPTELVIYDKHKEQIRKKKIPDKEYWVRYEMRFRQEKAKKVAFAIASLSKNENDDSYGVNLQTFALSQLYAMIDFKEDNTKDLRNQKNVKTDKRYLDFLNNVEKGSLKTQNNNQSHFENYLKSAIPYILSYFLIVYKKNNKDFNLFNLEIYNLFIKNLEFSKARFQKINIYLKNLNVTPINDAEMIELHEKLKQLIETEKLPF